MNQFERLKDDYEHMSQWHRDLLGDMAKDFRKQSTAASPQTVRTALSLVLTTHLAAVRTPDQLVGHTIKSTLPDGPAKTVGGK